MFANIQRALRADGATVEIERRNQMYYVTLKMKDTVIAYGAGSDFTEIPLQIALNELDFALKIRPGCVPQE